MGEIKDQSRARGIDANHPASQNNLDFGVGMDGDDVNDFNFGDMIGSGTKGNPAKKATPKNDDFNFNFDNSGSPK